MGKLKTYKVLTMTNEEPVFENIKLRVDSIDKKGEIVLPITLEEQGITWFLFEEDIKELLRKEDTAEVNFAEIGAGSAIFSILVAKNLGASRVVAIEREPVIAEVAEYNISTNNVSQKVSLRTETYSLDSLPLGNTKVIFINPPYHLYPSEIENFIPSHARGGSYGLEEFYSQLVKASFHLKKDGLIIFHKMELGNKEFPNYVEFIRKLFPSADLIYYNIFPPIKTEEFLHAIYEDKFSQWQEKVASQFPYLHYTSGKIIPFGKKSLEHRELPLALQELTEYRNWKDRIELHKKIVEKSLRED